MPPVNAALKREPTVTTRPRTQTEIISSVPALHGPARATSPKTAVGGQKVRPVAVPSPTAAKRENGLSFQARVPVIVGEASFRGWLPVDGIISGQLGANGGGLAIRQRPKNGSGKSEPELTGEICFKDLL